MKTSTFTTRSITILCLLICSAWLVAPANSSAQVVVGSWQNQTGDGWIDWGDQLSITNSSNTAVYSFASGAVAGYTQSLQITDSGNHQNLAVKLENLPGGMAAFLTNKYLSFTFSVPSSASSGATAGYSQLYELAINASGYGFNSQPFSNFTETGTTNNNQSGQPNFYFSSGTPAQSQVVTVNYSNILSSITATASTGYIELIFSFNNGGGAPANYFMNNVVLSSTPPVPPATNVIVVDNFAPAGVGPQNPTSFDYYTASNKYSVGQITNVWWEWAGYSNPDAFQSLAWDSTSDANTNASSGSMKISLNWTPNSQFVLWDQGKVNNFFALNISATTYTNFQCDVRFAPGSASASGSFGSPIFGHLRFGDRTAAYTADWFGAVDIAATNTNWVHVSIPLNAVTDPNLTNILGLVIGIDSTYYSLNLSGPSTLWVDNVQFEGASSAISNPPPVMGIQKALPGLRIFAGSPINTYDREELATTDQNQSWINGSYPVSYSFTLLDAAHSSGFQTHIFLIPTATVASPNTIYNNEFVEYQASNNLWLQLVATNNGGVVANVAWKTNLPNANPNIVALSVSNATAVGTWTLKFTSASAGTLTAPGASPVAFTISDPKVSTDFANPMVAVFGLQPQTNTAFGAYEDYSQITVSGVTGTAENEVFANENNISGNWDITDSAQQSSLVLVSSSSPYWVSWTVPANNYDVAVAPDVTSGNWHLLGYNNGFFDNPTETTMGGKQTWTLVNTNMVPSLTNSFFRLFNPPLNN